MRIVDITETNSVELWPGRRLYVPKEQLLVTLPKGAASVNGRSISFGGIGKSTVQVVGKVELIEKLFDAIVEMERPEAAVRL